ncbi:MAG: hypothetical protein JST90_14585 [Bacteroidetes bacterium]|nr:hypothetical protein [Bacteroidota bacterium]
MKNKMKIFGWSLRFIILGYFCMAASCNNLTLDCGGLTHIDAIFGMGGNQNFGCYYGNPAYLVQNGQAVLTFSVIGPACNSYYKITSGNFNSYFQGSDAYIPVPVGGDVHVNIQMQELGCGAPDAIDGNGNCHTWTHSSAFNLPSGTTGPFAHGSVSLFDDYLQPCIN